MDRRLYRWNMWRVYRTQPCDKSTYDAARFFFPCKEIVARSAEGYRCEVHTKVDPHWDRPRDYKIYRDAMILPSWTKQRLAQVIPVGERNTAVFAIAKDCARCGFTEEQAIGRILDSATFKGTKVDDALGREILQAVRSGFKSADLEGEKGGGNGRNK